MIGAVAIAAAGQPVRAAVRSGSAGDIVNRTDCPADPSVNCGAGTYSVLHYGGVGVAANASAENLDGTGASAALRGEFGEGYLPNLGISTFSDTATRTSAGIFVFNTYTYNGSQAIDLVLNGYIDYTNSGVQGTSPTNSAGNGYLSASMRIFSTSILDTLPDNPTPADIWSTPYVALGSCATGDIASSSTIAQREAAGSHTASLSLETACDGAAITINPGDSFVVGASLQSVSNRGGFVDAMHTFRVAYDGDRTVFTGTDTAVGAQFFADNFAIAGVPEPSSWAMFVIGFGLLGATMRRRGRIAVSVA